MAKVVKQFPGVPDGEVYPRLFVPGDTVTGELATVALREGWAEDESAESMAEKAIKAAPRNKAVKDRKSVV